MEGLASPVSSRWLSAHLIDISEGLNKPPGIGLVCVQSRTICKSHQTRYFDESVFQDRSQRRDSLALSGDVVWT